MNQLGGFPLLSLIICLPLLGAGVTLLIPRDRHETLRWVGLLTAASDLLVALFLILGWASDPSGEVQFVDGPWAHVPSLGIAYHVGVDGISLPFVMLTVLLVPLTMLLSAQDHPDSGRTKSSVFWALVLESGLLGALSALDLLLLCSFWTVSLLAVILLADPGGEGTVARSRLATLAALVAASLLATVVGASGPSGTCSLPALRAASFPWQKQAWLFWTSVAACGLTAAAFPLHTWYPQVCSTVPASLRLLIGALLLNLGGYGLIRVAIALFPLAAVSFAPVLMILGTAGLVYGATVALGQPDIHSALAYWRIAQTGLSIVGIFALRDLGLHGAILQFVTGSLAISTLLILVSGGASGGGARVGSSRWHRISLTVGFLSAIGVPGFAGFVGQALLVMQIVRWDWFDSTPPELGGPWTWLWRALVCGGMLASTGALLRAWRRAAATLAAPSTQRIHLALVIVVLIVVLGLRPIAASDAIGPAVYRLLNEVQEGVQQDLGEMALLTGSSGTQSAYTAGPPVGDDLSAAPNRPVTEPALVGVR